MVLILYNSDLYSYFILFVWIKFWHFLNSALTSHHIMQQLLLCICWFLYHANAIFVVRIFNQFSSKERLLCFLSALPGSNVCEGAMMVRIYDLCRVMHWDFWRNCHLLTGMELNSSVCVITMYFYFLLTPQVYVGISTKFLVLVQKKMQIFCTSEALTKYQSARLGFQPRTHGNLIDRSSLFYHYARSTCAFQNIINFDFSPKTDKDMTKHKKVVWRGGWYTSH